MPPSGTSDPLPGRRPAPPSEATPGYPGLTDEDRETLKTIPVAPDDARKEIGGVVAGVIVESIQYDDGRTDNRGTEATVTGNNIVAKACDEAIASSRIADIIEHIGGASKSGEGKGYMTEKTIATQDRKRRADYSMGVEDDPEKKFPSGHINTASTRADGTLTGREQSAYDAMKRAVEKLDPELVQTIPKFKEGDDPEEYAKKARGACDKVVGALEKLILDSKRPQI